MGRFSGIQNARQSGGGVYFKEGDYLVEITKVHVFASREKGDLFFIETVVLESEGSDANPVGSKPSQSIKLSLDSAKGNINGFVSGVMGCKPEEVTEEMVEEIVSDANPLKGERAMVNAVNKSKKHSEGEFTNLTWTGVPKETTKPKR